VANVNKQDMLVLRDLLEAGKVKPVIDRRYEFSKAAEAMQVLGEGHAKAKIVITV
jgi:NADPH:quinone reductase-like Zn-dependent oxidoreductase